MNQPRAPMHSLPPIVAEKLATFAQLRPDFESSFLYLQDVHGQRRLQNVPIPAIVRYLHALWVCECKDRLLSVPGTSARYDGQRALEVLAEWQSGESAAVVDFLSSKLDMLSFSAITRQIDDMRRAGDDPERARRLAHGRQVLLNRAFNLYFALETLFALSPAAQQQAVRAAAAHTGHRPGQITEQLGSLADPRYAPVAHPALAQRNMVVMNALGVQVTTNEADQPGHRTPAVARPTIPEGAYAQETIVGEVELLSPARGTQAYMPADEAIAAPVSAPSAVPEPSDEVEQHPELL